MRIEVEHLSDVLMKLMEHAEEMSGGTIEIEEDLYWFIPKEQLYVPEQEPKEMSLGSLNDDWEILRGLATGEKEAFGYMMVWAAGILRVFGDRTL